MLTGGVDHIFRPTSISYFIALEYEMMKESAGKGFHITGNPGIGKSYFVMYS